jgi:glyceraldehyde 3-phosphate dehydrogenase
MIYNLGINRFGRIARLVFRAAIERGRSVSTINDPFMSMGYLLYQLHYNTVHGKFRFPAIKIFDKEFEIN